MYLLKQSLQPVDHVPTTLPDPTYLASLVLLEDNDVVIKMLIKAEKNKIRHAPRMHRIDLDWLFDIMRDDQA